MATGSRIGIEQVRRYARMNLVVGFLVWGIALAGISMMMPVMYNSVAKDMHWTVAQTTSFMAIKSGVSAVGGLFAGALIVRFGMRRVFLPSMVTIGLSTALLFFVRSLPTYYLLAATSGFASILALVAIQVTMARWYAASLGRMTGIAMLGGAVAGFIVPMATTLGVARFGWHATAGIAGLFVLFVVTVAISFLIHESPETYGYTALELDPPAAATGAQADRPAQAVGREVVLQQRQRRRVQRGLAGADADARQEQRRVGRGEAAGHRHEAPDGDAVEDQPGGLQLSARPACRAIADARPSRARNPYAGQPVVELDLFPRRSRFRRHVESPLSCKQTAIYFFLYFLFYVSVLAFNITSR